MWLPVKGYEDLYLVSNEGQVISLPRVTQMPKGGVRRDGGKTLKSKLDRYGYPVVTLCGPYGEKTVKVHRIVATAFIPNPLNLPQVNHKDSNRQNYQADNLEWVTQKQNTKHAQDSGVIFGNFTSPRDAKGRYGTA